MRTIPSKKQYANNKPCIEIESETQEGETIREAIDRLKEDVMAAMNQLEAELEGHQNTSLVFDNSNDDAWDLVY